MFKIKLLMSSINLFVCQMKQHNQGMKHSRSDAIVVVHHPELREESYKSWYFEAERYQRVRPPLVLFTSTKCDLSNGLQVVHGQEVEEFAKQKSCRFILTSAKNSVNIQYLFEEVGKEIIKRKVGIPNGTWKSEIGKVREWGNSFNQIVLLVLLIHKRHKKKEKGKGVQKGEDKLMKDLPKPIVLLILSKLSELVHCEEGVTWLYRFHLELKKK